MAKAAHSKGYDNPIHADSKSAIAEPAMTPGHEDVARLAYLYWEARGFQGGSPEEDWFRAEEQLKHKQDTPADRRSSRPESELPAEDETTALRNHMPNSRSSRQSP